ncbi:AraC family transcriptional regulator [Nocardiopsis mangrovi]|uniref:AraC family transcriptional regulator n=1 Tax=Nocardiopsis mangrovi TaxID=1179818 RepID=A0ABV9DU40_9ACTN
MFTKLIDSREFPQRERFDWWWQWMNGTHAPMHLRSEHTEDFRFHGRVMGVGPVQVWRIANDPVVFKRTHALVRASDPERFHITYIQHGYMAADRDGHQTVHRVGQLQTNDTSQRCEMTSTSDDGLVRAICTDMPMDLVALPRKLTDRALGGPISARQGPGSLLAGFLTHLIADAENLNPADGPRLGTVLADLVAAVFTHAADEDKALTPEARRRTLLLGAQAFILDHLHHTDLTPDAVAAAQHVSVRYLHQLFGPTGTTVSAWIRTQRLELARRDLADPALCHMSVGAIGHRWGFPRPAAFTRAFRTAHGMTPTDYRHHHQSPPGTGSAQDHAAAPEG